MPVIANDVLTDVSLALLEDRVSTTLGTAVGAPGVATVAPPSMDAIYAGAMLIVGTGANLEIITVSTVTSTTFTATFANTHLSSDPLLGATFPSSQLDHPLYSQQELLGYLLEAENDFLLRVRPLYESNNLNYTIGNRFYSQPASAIRVERIDVGGLDLIETTQTDLDLENPAWTSETGVLGDPKDPGKWFRDQTDTGLLGLYPLPQQAGTAEVWDSMKEIGPLNLLSTLVIPDVFMFALKYGVLARVWGKEWETRDPFRAKYCSKRFDFLVMIAQRFLEGVGMPQQDGQQEQSFSPLAVQA